MIFRARNPLDRDRLWQWARQSIHHNKLGSTWIKLRACADQFKSGQITHQLSFPLRYFYNFFVHFSEHNTHKKEVDTALLSERWIAFWCRKCVLSVTCTMWWVRVQIPQSSCSTISCENSFFSHLDFNVFILHFFLSSENVLSSGLLKSCVEFYFWNLRWILSVAFMN